MSLLRCNIVGVEEAVQEFSLRFGRLIISRWSLVLTGQLEVASFDASWPFSVIDEGVGIDCTRGFFPDNE